MAWHHFNPDPPAGPKSQMAEIQLRFYRSFHPDLLKVMHDVPFQPINELNTPEDWRSIPVLDPNEGNFGLQLHTLREIRKGLDSNVPMVETLFGVYSYARDISKGKLLEHLRADPDSVNVGLAALAESLKSYARASLESGSEGVFYALSGASAEGATREEYAATFLQYDKGILCSVDDAPFNILHLHGYTDLYFDLIHNLPAAIVNWSDRAGGPTISDARKIHRGCILGGVDEKRFNNMTVQQISNLGRAAIAEAGVRHFILGPGCSVPDNSSVEKLQAIAQAAALA
jgi:uroporphyrinogen decarboxylase